MAHVVYRCFQVENVNFVIIFLPSKRISIQSFAGLAS